VSVVIGVSLGIEFGEVHVGIETSREEEEKDIDYGNKVEDCIGEDDDRKRSGVASCKGSDTGDGYGEEDDGVGNRKPDHALSKPQHGGIDKVLSNRQAPTIPSAHVLQLPFTTKVNEISSDSQEYNRVEDDGKPAREKFLRCN
jgi:hypothetical protein